MFAYNTYQNIQVFDRFMDCGRKFEKDAELINHMLEVPSVKETNLDILALLHFHGELE
jgi:hypothetical protein